MKKYLILICISLLISCKPAQKPELILPVGHMGNVSTVSFSKDSKYVVTASEDRTAKIWDVSRGRLLHNLEGHTDILYSAAFSSEGSKVMTLSRDKTVKIWDALTGELKHSSLSPLSVSSRTKLSSDGKMVLAIGESGSDDRAYEMVCLWDVQKKKWTLLHSLKGTYLSYGNPFVFSPDNKSFGFLSYDETLTKTNAEPFEVRIADTKSGKVLHKLEKLRYDDLNSADFSPDGRYFLTASPGSIKIWDIETENLISTIPGAGYFAFSNDGKKIVTISSDTTRIMIGEDRKRDPSVVKICEIPSGKILSFFDTISSSIEPAEVSFSPDDTRLLISDNNGSIIIWDILNGKDLFYFEGRGPVALSPDSKTLITSTNAFLASSLDGSKLWDAQSGRLLHLLKGHTTYISYSKFSLNGENILTDSWPTTVKLWDIRNGKLLYSLKRDPFIAESFVSSPDGKYIMTTSKNSATQIWDAAGGKLLFSFIVDGSVGRRFSKTLFSVKFSPDSKTLVSSSSGNPAVHVYDLEKAKLKFEFEFPSSVRLIAFNTDGTLLGIALDDGTARVLDLSSGIIKFTLKSVPRNKVEELAGFTSADLIPVSASPAKISPDGNVIITFPSEDSTEVWDAVNGRLLYTLNRDIKVPEHPFSSGSKSFITTSFNNAGGFQSGYSTTLRDIYTGNPIRSFKGRVSSFAPITESEVRYGIDQPISQDNSKIMTISGSGEVNIWNFETGELIRSFPEKPDSVPLDPYSSRFSWNGENIISKTIEGDVGIWDIKTGKILQSIKMGSSANVGYEPISPNGKYLLDADFGGSTIIRDLQVPGSSRTLGFHIGTMGAGEPDNPLNIESFIFSPDGSYILTRSVEGTTKIWESKSGKVLQSFTQQTDTSFVKKGCLLSGPFSPDSKKILGDCDGSTAIWDIQNQIWLPGPENSDGDAGDYRFTPDSKRIVVKYNSILKLWDFQLKKYISLVAGSDEGISSLLFCTDGTKTLATLDNGSSCLWNTKDGKVIKRYNTTPVEPDNETKEDNPGVKSIVFSPDGKYIVTTSENDLKIWDGLTGSSLFLYKPEGEAFDIRLPQFPFSPDSKSLLADVYSLSDNSGSASNFHSEIINVPTGKAKYAFGGQAFRGLDLVNGIISNPFSPDGQKFLTLASDNVIKVWNSSTGKLLFNLGWKDKERKAGSAFFNPDDKTILTSSFIVNDKDYITSYEPLDLWSTATGKVLQTINIGSARIGDINWSDALVNSIRNSKISLYDLKSGKEKVSFIAIDEDDYVFVLPSGEYMGTSGGVKYLSWKLNNKLYDFDQWDLQYNRPDKVLEQLGNKDTALIGMYRKAYLKRLKRAGFTEEMFTSEWHAPESKILNTEEFTTPVTNPDKQLKVSLSDSKYNLDRVNVWINDVPIAGKNGISLHDTPSSSVIREIPLTLSAGINKIQISCINEKGVESLKEAVEIVYNPVTESKPDLYVIAMSVSAYKDNNYDLQYAVKDGRDIASMFNSESPDKTGYNRIYIDTLFNNLATKEKFSGLREKLLATNVDDQVVVFVSGHGLLDKNMDFYFATYDLDFSEPEKRGISFDDLEDMLDSIPARKKLMMMDACHSGEIDKEETGLLAINTATSSDVTFRGSVKEYNFKGINSTISQSGVNLKSSFELMQELFTGLDKGTGTVVISAAAGKGYALESPLWNNGVFTYTILNGLKNKAADQNNDKQITISELKEYSIKQVEELTGGKQKPTARKESIGFDWKIW